MDWTDLIGHYFNYPIRAGLNCNVWLYLYDTNDKNCLQQKPDINNIWDYMIVLISTANNKDSI